MKKSKTVSNIRHEFNLNLTESIRFISKSDGTHSITSESTSTDWDVISVGSMVSDCSQFNKKRKPVQTNLRVEFPSNDNSTILYLNSENLSNNDMLLKLTPYRLETKKCESLCSDDTIINMLSASAHSQELIGELNFHRDNLSTFMVDQNVSPLANR